MDAGFVEALLQGADVKKAYPETIGYDHIIKAIEDDIDITEFERMVSDLPRPEQTPLAFLVGFAAHCSEKKYEVLKNKFGLTLEDARMHNFVSIASGMSKVTYSI